MRKYSLNAFQSILYYLPYQYFWTVGFKLRKVSLGLLIGFIVLVSRHRDALIKFMPFSNQVSSNQSPESKSCRVSESTSTSTVNTVTTESTQL